MYTVIGHPRSRVVRIVWALEEMDLDYTLDPQPPHSPAVMALTPTGKVPLLQTDEGTLTDSVAILTFLADRHDLLTLPAGSIGRARQDALTQYIVSELDAALWTYAKHSFVLPEDWRVPAVKATARKEFERAFGVLERMKGDSEFLAGDRLTIADILLGHCAAWGQSIRFELPGGAMGDYLEAVRTRPAMQRAVARLEAA